MLPPAITGSSFLRNNTGIEATDNNALSISQSQLTGNTALAVDNKTPNTVINALGNWWGHASGPKEPVGNPSGQGDSISTGINYGNFKSALTLINPSVRLQEPATYHEQHDITLDVSCINATEYRVSESNNFTNSTPLPLTDYRAQATVTLSEGDGNKQVYVEFRGTDNTTAVVPLAGGVLVDTQAPMVNLTNPANGSLVSGPITITATATDAAGISKVQLFLDGQLVTTKTTSPYTYSWNTNNSTDGSHVIKAIATDKAGRTAEQVATINLARILPAADTTGPVLSNPNTFLGLLSNGLIFTRSGTVSITASDPSGISRVDLLLDGSFIATATGSGTYNALLNIDNVANGAYALGWKATDSLGNATTQSYDITVAHAPPPAPVLSQPANGTSVRTATVTVAGTAKANSQVQMINNGESAGGLIIAGADGRFSAAVTLAKGNNQIQATATDQYGTSLASNLLTVTLDDSIPTSPSNLTATAQAAGKVRLAWIGSTDASTAGYDLYRASSAFSSISGAAKINANLLGATAFDDLPPQDGSWFYRVVAVNKVGTPSEPSNLAQAVADNTLPLALSINYAPQGSFDPQTGLIGQGAVNLVLTTSEELPNTPFLSVVPLGGTPMPVALTQTGAATYSGSFNITSKTPSGPANALFSARDAVGNRGTDIDQGATLKFDTAGPALSTIELDPASPINYTADQVIHATFTFSKPPVATPLVDVLLSGTGRSPIALTELTKDDDITWKGSFTLPDNAGLQKPEMLSFTFKAIDQLNNESTKVLDSNNFQVYQGELPPLEIPFALTAKAQPGGKVKLAWQTVEQAVSYQLYRQAPGQTSLDAFTRVSGTDYLDQTEQDGSYLYSVASVRQANSQEALSAQSPSVTVIASATPPDAPKNLALRLSGQGIVASWQAPAQGTVDSYNLYRAVGTAITNVDGMTPLKTGIKQLTTIDTTPTSNQGAYVVTALDAAGNESTASNSVYLNASLLPVSRVKISHTVGSLPVISWIPPNGNVSNYKIYADTGINNEKTALTPNAIIGTSYTDAGYNGGNRSYTVATVDANAVEMPRSLLLPNVTATITSGLPVKRGVMNLLQVQVTNQSNKVLDNVRAAIKVPTDKLATQFKDHLSQPVTIEAGQSRVIPVVVGGYEGLPDVALAQVRVEIAPNEGELVSINQDQQVPVTEGSLVIGISTYDFTRGAAGKIKLNFENTTETEIELLTATQNGRGESTDVRFVILDKDGNVLATQPYKQALGANVVSLPNGQTVARIAPGANYVSDEFSLDVPAACPTDIRVRLEVDRFRYHTGQDDAVIVTGRGSEKAVTLVDTAYYGEVTEATPTSSYGNQDITIKGRALDRSTDQPMPNTRLKLVLNQQGFERVFSVVTDNTGHFSSVFSPTSTDSGLYKVSAVHPDVTDRPEQVTFTINRVNVEPTLIKLDVPKNYPSAIPISARSGPGSAATNLRLVYDAASQVTGNLATGIDIQLPSPVSLTNKQTVALPVQFTANNDAQQSGSLIFNVISDEHANAPLAAVRVDYNLTEAKPYLTAMPSFVETGMATGERQLETIRIQNKGLKEAQNLSYKLLSETGGTAPTWAALASQPSDNLAVGTDQNLDLSFTPPDGTNQGVHRFKLNITGDNISPQNINVFVNLTQSGQGNLLFKASDIYTATVGKNGQLIQGLGGARITVQNEDVPTINQELVTDSLGEALFQDLPTGRYKFRATATNHQEIGGRLLVKPGITVNQPVFLQYNLISVEWSVREITIQDRYEITLSATYETDVPAPVVVIEPTSTNLPKMAEGEVFYGELNITNHGLVRADHVTQKLPASDSTFRFEFLADVPTNLQAKQRVTIPYRVIALKDLETEASAGTASGGGCYSYSKNYGINYNYECANGVVSAGNASASWFTASTSTCPTGGTGSTSVPIKRIYINNLGGPWNVGGYKPAGAGYLGGQRKCAVCPSCKKNK